MVTDEATPLVVDIAKSFILLVREIAPSWSKAYLRFSNQGSVSQVKGSYTHGSGVDIIDTTEHKDFFHRVARKGKELLNALGKSDGVFLVVVDPKFDYEIKFEYQDMNRWQISKLSGGTGIPAGVDA